MIGKNTTAGNDNGDKTGRLNLSGVAIKRAPLTIAMIVLFMIAGVIAYFQLGREENPAFAFRVMVVRVMWPGATTQEVEQQVVDKIERKLQETPHLKAVRSYSKPGEGVVFVELLEDFPAKEVPSVWYQIRKKVGDVRSSLPEGTIGPFFNDEFGDTHIATYALRGEGFSYAELKSQADIIRNRLLIVPGVEKVDLIGAQEERIFIEIDTKRLAQMGVTADAIRAAIAQQNAVSASGIIHTSDRQIQVRATGAIDGLASISQIPIAAGNRLVRLADVAQITRGFVDPAQYRMRFQGQSALGLGVIMAAGKNVIDVGKGLDAAVIELTETTPKGILIDKATFQSTTVTSSVNEFLLKFAFAVGIVLLVSFFSLGHRSGVVVALSIPLVLALTFGFMWYMGISFQRISLGALIISLGLLVDDAMISVEMMQRKLEEGWSKLDAATFAYKSTAFPMLTGTLITVAGFLPVFLAKSSTGEYVSSLFLVLSFAMLTSWLVAVYFTPYIGTLILKEQVGKHEEVFDTPFYKRLRGAVTWCLSNRKTVILATGLLFVIGGAGMGTLKKQFFPYSTREEILVDLWLPEGTSFAETQATAEKMEQYLLKSPTLSADMQHVASYVGGGAQRFYLTIDQQLLNTNLAQVVVTAKDLKARERLITEIRGELAAHFPGVRSKVDRLPSGPPVGWPVQMRVKGPDHAEVRKIAEQVKSVMRDYPDTLNVHDDWHERIPSVRLEIDQSRARALGVSTESVKQAVAGAFSGGSVTAYRDGNEAVLVELRSPLAERTSLGSVENLYVPTARGGSVPLSQVARAVPTFEEGVLWRRDRLPTITVQAEIRDGLESPDVALAVYNKLGDIIAKLPAGYSIEAGGAYEDSLRANASVNVNLPIVFIATFLLLLVQLNNLKKATLVVLTAPLGIIGAAFALHATGQPFGFVAILGINALAGMIMRNSVILVDQVAQDMSAGVDAWSAIIEATVRRFRPIALTAAAAVFAFIPLTQSTLWGPMAIALIGGLIVATVLTLTFLPALYAAWFKASPPRAVNPVQTNPPSNTVVIPV
jgi:multidrug efflux pump